MKAKKALVSFQKTNSYTVYRFVSGYSTFQKSDTNSIILIQPYFGLMKVRAMRSILQPNLIFKGAFGGLSKNMVSATT